MEKQNKKHDLPGAASQADTIWEKRDQWLSDWMPYVLMTISFVLAMAGTNQSLENRLWIIGLSAAALAWVYLMYTRVPGPRLEKQERMIPYFMELMFFCALLMLRQPIFLVFAITGFFHAALLKPWPLKIVGVFLTSALIHALSTGFPWRTLDLWILFPTIIVIQTVAIGAGIVIGEKLTELSVQRKQAVERLEAALEENAELHAQLLTQAREAGVLDERQRMAREIHDTLAQGLTGIITQLEAVKQAKGRPEDWQRHLDNAERLARESLSEARRSVQAGRPEPLDDADLPDALAKVAHQWSAMNGVPVEVVTTGEPLPLHQEVEVALLRTAQEALANVAQHANASRAGLTLSYMGDVVTLDVRDDGVGFEVPNGSNGHGAGFGLTAMRQRVNRVAGTLVVESEPGGGTAISARVPAIVAQQEVGES